MAFSARSQLVALLTIAALAARPAAAQRPTLEEWKAGKANETAEAQAQVAKEKKMAAVGKCVQLLETLRAQVLHEGEAEAVTYDKFGCFCRDTTKERSEAISKGTDQKATLSSDIEALESRRLTLDTRIQQLNTDIAQAQLEMKQAAAVRAQENKLYTHNDADLKAALEALEGAIQSMKASKSPSLLQLKAAAPALRSALLLADTLGLGGKAATETAALLQQAPEVAMENYKFHSDGIIKTLETLLRDFRAEKVEVDKAEVSAAAAHDIFMQDKTDTVERKTRELADTQAEKERTAEKIGAKSQELSTVAATLLDDQEYLMKLSNMCRDKAKTWDQRSQVRQNELYTLTEVINVIAGYVREKTTAATIRFAQQAVSVRLAQAVASDEGSMESLEAAAEAAEAAPAFLQQAQRERPEALVSVAVRRHLRAQTAPATGNKAVAELLKRKGLELKSTLLSALASKITAEDPFAKVKQLIQELIERLLQEAANEGTHKGWCDTATSDAKQKRDYAAKEIRSLNSEMAELEAQIALLEEELAELAAAIGEIQAERAKAVRLRADEKAENANTVQEAQHGMAALDMAVDVLSKFYKTVAKESVDLSLNATSFTQRQPAQDAPDAGFAIGEAYTGAQSEAGGILGMMEVMKSDFVRTISETEEAEAQAKQDHLVYMTQSGASLAQKQEAEAARNRQKNSAEDKLSTADDSMQAQTARLETAIKELLELKPVCIDTGMSYADRVARREEEIAALHKALCVLGAYEKYGPTGTADAC